MIKKKSRFLTFVFSMLPGAGHMYMGLMKMGLSFMSAFFFLIFLSSWLDIGPLVYVLPLVWFYSFFDCLNKSSLNEEQLVLLEDKYLFSINNLLALDKKLFVKSRVFGGLILLFLGLNLIANNLLSASFNYIPLKVYDGLSLLVNQTPKILIGIVIIIIGVKLILGKKKENEIDD